MIFVTGLILVFCGVLLWFITRGRRGWLVVMFAAIGFIAYMVGFLAMVASVLILLSRVMP